MCIRDRGHTDPKSTEIYLHVSNKTLLGIKSPFDVQEDQAWKIQLYRIYFTCLLYTSPVFGVEMIWDEAEKYSADKKARTEAALSDGEIILSGGHMTVPQLEDVYKRQIQDRCFSDYH